MVVQFHHCCVMSNLSKCTCFIFFSYVVLLNDSSLQEILLPWLFWKNWKQQCNVAYARNACNKHHTSLGKPRNVSTFCLRRTFRLVDVFGCWWKFGGGIFWMGGLLFIVGGIVFVEVVFLKVVRRFVWKSSLESFFVLEKGKKYWWIDIKMFGWLVSFFISLNFRAVMGFVWVPCWLLDGILNPDMSGPSLPGLLPQGRCMWTSVPSMLVRFLLLSSFESEWMLSDFTLTKTNNLKNPCGYTPWN